MWNKEGKIVIKYIFCLIAILVQPLFSFLVFRKQEKQKAALKMPLLYLSGFYLIIQFVVFYKICLKIPEKYEICGYLLQCIILIGFILIEFAMAVSNRYISRIQQKEQNSIADFKSLIQQIEICRTQISDTTNLRALDQIIDKMHYSDPVSSPAVTEENKKIKILINRLSETDDCALFSKICEDISKQLEIRKSKNTKEKG